MEVGWADDLCPCQLPPVDSRVQRHPDNPRFCNHRRAGRAPREVPWPSSCPVAPPFAGGRAGDKKVGSSNPTRAPKQKLLWLPWACRSVVVGPVYGLWVLLSIPSEFLGTPRPCLSAPLRQARRVHRFCDPLGFFSIPKEFLGTPRPCLGNLCAKLNRPSTFAVRASALLGAPDPG